MIDELQKALREHPDYYYSWQSNIAMAFIDEVNRFKRNQDKRNLSKADIHNVANEAAKKFLNRLIKATNGQQNNFDRQRGEGPGKPNL